MCLFPFYEIQNPFSTAIVINNFVDEIYTATAKHIFYFNVDVVTHQAFTQSSTAQHIVHVFPLELPCGIKLVLSNYALAYMTTAANSVSSVEIVF